jgi:hypothetical protein
MPFNNTRLVDHFIQPVRLKLERAAKQRDALLTTGTSWVLQNPAKCHVEYLPARHGFKLLLAPFLEPPPLDELGLAFGEYTHNLRSALDNLAFALARLQDDPPPKPKDIAFPIFDNREAYARNCKRYLLQLPAKAAALIESIQPYHRDSPGLKKLSAFDPLIQLQRMNNMDKHQAPSLALFAPKHMNHFGSVRFENAEAAKLNIPPDVVIWGGPLAPDVVLLEYRTKHPLVEIGGDFQMQADLSVVCEQDIYPFVELVRNLHHYVSLVVDQFIPFFIPR